MPYRIIVAIALLVPSVSVEAVVIDWVPYTPQQITLAPTKDMRIVAGGGYEHKSWDQTVFTGGEDWYVDSRAFIHFDLSAIPQDANVSSADFTLYTHDNWGRNPDRRWWQVYRVTSDWNEYNATWYSSGIRNWIHGGGGDYVGTNGALRANPYAQINPNPPHASPVTWQLSNLVGEWVSGQHANYGLAIDQDARAVQNYHFHTREAGDSSLRPSLTVEYTRNPNIIMSANLIGGDGNYAPYLQSMAGPMAAGIIQINGIASDALLTQIPIAIDLLGDEADIQATIATLLGLGLDVQAIDGPGAFDVMLTMSHPQDGMDPVLEWDFTDMGVQVNQLELMSDDLSSVPGPLAAVAGLVMLGIRLNRRKIRA